MRLPLTDGQREHLGRVREGQLSMWRGGRPPVGGGALSMGRDGRPQVVDELFVTDEVVRLMSGMGRACYLGLDGRGWVGNLGEGKLPRVLDNPKDVASCIVRWASAVGLPELVEALPPMPEGAEVCSLCKGTREMPEEFMPRGE